MIIVTVIMINLFIAILGETYAEISKAKKEWLRQV